MNKEQVRLCLKAGQKAGLKLKPVIRISGCDGVDWQYCKSGLTIGFNPWNSLEHSMLIALECCESPSWDEKFFTVYPKGSGFTDKSMHLAKLSGKTIKEKTWSIGNAIVNAANYDIEKNNMKFTNAELQLRKRECKKLRGLKELRGVYVSLDEYEEQKVKVIKYVKKINGDQQ